MDIIDQIRQAANIVDIASQYTTIQKRGKRFVGLCPFHSEKSPSFTVDDERQLFHCFGCGAGGDVFTLVMEKENLSFPEALKFLAEKYDIPIPEKKKLSPQVIKLEEKLYKICEDALAFFRKNLHATQEGQKALDYLHQRNISDDLIQNLKIGYAPNSWDALLAYFKNKNTSPTLLEKAGLVLRSQKKEGHYDRFRGRIIFPIFTGTGKVVAFGGRTIIDADPKYLNSPDTPIYSKGKLLYGLNFCRDSIREKDSVILVEGYTDLLALLQAGIHNAAASLGTSLTSDQISLAQRFASQIIISYDADEAGRKAALRAVSLCFEKGIQIRILLLPKGTDPDSFIQKNGPQAFLNLVRESQSGLRFLIEAHTQKIDLKIPEQKARVTKTILAEIEKIPDPVIQSEYIKQTGGFLDIEENILRFSIKRKLLKKDQDDTKSFLNAEKRLLQIIFEDAHIAPAVFKEMKRDDFKGLMSEPIFETLSEFFRDGMTPDLQKCKDKIGHSLSSALAEIRFEKCSPPSLEEAKDCLSTLRELSLKKKWKDIDTQISKLQKKGDTKQISLLLKQRQAITEELTKQN